MVFVNRKRLKTTSKTLSEVWEKPRRKGNRLWANWNPKNIKSTLLQVCKQKMPTARHHEVLNLAPHNATLIMSPSYPCFQLYSNWTLLNVWKPQFTRSWSSHCKFIFNDMFALGFTATDKNSFLLKQILTKSINLRRYWWEKNTTLSEGAGHSHPMVLLSWQRPTPSIYWAFSGLLQLPTCRVWAGPATKTGCHGQRWKKSYCSPTHCPRPAR